MNDKTDLEATPLVIRQPLKRRLPLGIVDILSVVVKQWRLLCFLAGALLVVLSLFRIVPQGVGWFGMIVVYNFVTSRHNPTENIIRYNQDIGIQQ